MTIAAFGSRANKLLLLLLMGLLLVPGSRAARTENILSNFNLIEGYDASWGVTLDSKGNLFGAALYGGSGAECAGGCGIIFKVARDTSGVWTKSTLYTFSGGADGEHPFSPLTVDAMGISTAPRRGPSAMAKLF